MHLSSTVCTIQRSPCYDRQEDAQLLLRCLQLIYCQRTKQPAGFQIIVDIFGILYLFERQFYRYKKHNSLYVRLYGFGYLSLKPSISNLPVTERLCQIHPYILTMYIITPHPENRTQEATAARSAAENKPTKPKHQNRTSPRPISTDQLNALPRLHLPPINLVVYKGPY